ncbi:calcium-activated chloride channel-domain-containing protein [Chytridium lagenaria]|nr:calcium-activated chloride channel-domain-containing protein [Chytridium lagenaria]
MSFQPSQNDGTESEAPRPTETNEGEERKNNPRRKSKRDDEQKKVINTSNDFNADENGDTEPNTRDIDNIQQRLIQPPCGTHPPPSNHPPKTPISYAFPDRTEGWDAEPEGVKSSLKRTQPDQDDWSVVPEPLKVVVSGKEEKRKDERKEEKGKKMTPLQRQMKEGANEKEKKDGDEDGLGYVKRGQVVVKTLSERRSVKLFFKEDVEAFDRIMRWERSNSEKVPQKALELFCSEFRAADALIPIIYASETWDYVLRFRRSKKDQEIMELREAFEKRLLENGAIIEIEDSSENDKITFMKIILPFYVLSSLARHWKLRLPLSKLVHPLRDDALPKKRWTQYHMDLNNQRAVFDEERLERFQIRMMQPDGEYLVVPAGEQPMHVVKSYLFEGRHRIYLAYMLLTSTLLKVRRKSGCRNEGIYFLIKVGAYIDMFPTHEGNYYYNEMAWRKTSQESAGMQINTLRSRLREIYFKRSWFQPQPYELVKDYFGEKVALYFVYLGFYNIWLCISASMGLIVFFFGLIKILSSRDIQPSSWNLLFDNELTFPYAIAMSIWSVLYLEFWKRRSSYFAHLWGVQNFEKEEIRRHQFKPTTTICSPILSFHVLLIAILMVIATIFGQIVLFWYIKTNSQYPQAAAPASAFTGLACIFLGRLAFRPVCTALAGWENYRTETEYEDAWLLKIWTFEFFNIYLHVIYSAFLRPFVKISELTGIKNFVDQICTRNVCSAELTAELLIIFIGDQIFLRLSETVFPEIGKKMRSARKRKGVDPTAEVFYPQHYRDEKKADSKGISDDYFQKAVQYGYVTLFVAAFPVAPVFALINNFFESLLTIFVSNYFQIQVLQPYEESSWTSIRIGVFIVWHVFVYSVWFFIMWLIPNEPEIVHTAQKREAYLERISIDPNAEVEDERLDSQAAAVMTSEVDLRGKGWKLR